MAYKVKYSRKEKKELKKNKPDKSLNQNIEKSPDIWIDATKEYVFI